MADAIKRVPSAFRIITRPIYFFNYSSQVFGCNEDILVYHESIQYRLFDFRSCYCMQSYSAQNFSSPDARNRLRAAAERQKVTPTHWCHSERYTSCTPRFIVGPNRAKRHRVRNQLEPPRAVKCDVITIGECAVTCNPANALPDAKAFGLVIPPRWPL